MAFIEGTLGLGTGIAQNAIIEPSSSTYSRQPVYFNSALSGLALNLNQCTFGPSDGTWGTLVVFGVFDPDNNNVFTGTLNNPLTPGAGSLVTIPVQTIELELGQPLPGGVALAGFQTAISSGTPALLGPPSQTGGQPATYNFSSSILLNGGSVKVNPVPVVQNIAASQAFAPVQAGQILDFTVASTLFINPVSGATSALLICGTSGVVSVQASGSASLNGAVDGSMTLSQNMLYNLATSNGTAFFLK